MTALAARKAPTPRFGLLPPPRRSRFLPWDGPATKKTAAWPWAAARETQSMLAPDDLMTPAHLARSRITMSVKDCDVPPATS